jgi:hypothetical protein
MSVSMTMLILSQRIARGFNTITRPLRRSAPAAQPADLNVLPVPGIGLSRIDVDAMRRMW